jgi:putative nucleotidyltransferase with HDIG domain
MRRMRAHRSSGLLRSLTLLRTFVVACALILFVGGVALSSTLTSGLREAALEDNARDVALYVDAVLAPAVVRGQRVLVTGRTRGRLAAVTRRPEGIRGLNVWSTDGTLALSTRRPTRAGSRFRPPLGLREAVRTGRASADVVRRRGDGTPVVEVWSPLRTVRGRPVGAAQVSLDERVLEEAVGYSERTIWTAVALVFGGLWLVLALFVRGASARLRRQNDDLQARSRELLDTTRALEETLLETIETLNAAVEARDPYTAGHSQRVRRVALAVGRELALPAKRLGALGNAALFHDVGKIAVPDSILTKPEPLTPSEAALMREHAARGAEIVSRLSSLQDSAPAIRHHHERWDGLGYPDGLRESTIPLEAAIIGLADAWDAMTTDRPYASALTVDQAKQQLSAGSAKQFNPAVVDAFLAIARRRPGDVLPPEAPSLPLAASG